MSTLSRRMGDYEPFQSLPQEGRKLYNEAKNVVYRAEQAYDLLEERVGKDDDAKDLTVEVQSVMKGLTTRQEASKNLDQRLKTREGQALIEKLLAPKLVIPPGPPLRPGKYIAEKSADGTEIHLKRPQENNPVQEKDFDVSFRGLISKMDDDRVTYRLGDMGELTLNVEFLHNQLRYSGVVTVEVKGLPA
ncbi:hypothetical protein PBI_DEWDROP_11 [Microbacterium phage Dewdrop]|nr:hypothetical protein PBI_LEAF_11 [Microbacterium phage Leaf]QGZ17380.1 hypothetical protein PBI_DEWDROP_11 [Microbacterium phage Dewdrop]